MPLRPILPKLFIQKSRKSIEIPKLQHGDDNDLEISLAPSLEKND